MATYLELDIIQTDLKSRIVLSNPLKKSGFIPVEGTEIFVRGIPAYVSANRLAEYFGQAGEIFEIRLMMYDDMVKNRGFAFVSYMFIEAANKAMEDLTKQIFMGRKLEMNISLSNCKLFIGGIPKFLTHEDILRELKSQGMKGIVNVSMNKNSRYDKENRGYAFVEFLTHQRAAEVKTLFYGYLMLGGKYVFVEWSKTGRSIFDSWEEVVHVGNLTWAQTTAELKEIVLQFVGEESLKAIKKLRSYAFVHLVDRTTAEELMEKLKDYYKDTVVEVNWAKAPRRYDPCSRRESIIMKDDPINCASTTGTQMSGWNRNVRTVSGSSSGDSVSGTEV